MEPRFHQSDATVHADGDIYRCRANLRSWAEDPATGHPPVRTSQEQWAGRLHFDSDADAETVLYADAPHLVVDDTETTFTVDDLDRPTATLTIRGSGTPPF
ncbi:hypothetical protein [Streptomyces sp. NRRL B-24484]|uniref:hypothetical protein n=1 Tax=Streptomyces sp. NRRL B-24484 TaxID=1463833 RepID=UPI0004C01708|nr:hypothetical protein [Streptomyces sp. NRRL B-24484]